MKRVFLLAAFLMVATTWARPARAQIGILGLASNSGIGNHLDRQKNLAKLRQMNSLPPPPVAASTRAHHSQPVRSNPAAADRYGRVDLVGHPVSHYPTIRGDITGASGLGGSGRR